MRAITEEEDKVSLRDANSSRERPKLEGLDMDEDVVQEIEVNSYLSKFNIKYRPVKRNLPLMLMCLVSWISSSTPCILRRKSLSENSYLMHLMLWIK